MSKRGPIIELCRDDVARRAVQLWQAAGQPRGRDLGYWLQAEVELLSERQPRRHRAPFDTSLRSQAGSGFPDESAKT